MLCGFACQRSGRDAERANCRPGASHLNRGHARNDWGVRMVTNSLYGPAFTSSKTSLLPMWAQAGRAANSKPKNQSALPPSSPHAAHPPAKLQTKPGGDGGVDGSPQETLVKGCAVIGEEPFPHPVVSSGPRIIVKINSPEEAILARVREQEVGKRPLDCDQYGHEKHARDQGNLPRLPVLHPPPEQIKGQRRNQDEDRKLRRNQVGDRVEHRAELRLGRKSGRMRISAITMTV